MRTTPVAQVRALTNEELDLVSGGKKGQRDTQQRFENLVRDKVLTENEYWSIT